MTGNKIQRAYKESMPIYDEILRGRTWWSKLYLNVFWGGINDDKIAKELLLRISPLFKGKILDVPVGTGIFTAKHYRDLDVGGIIGVDYSEDMLDRCEELMSLNGVKIQLEQGDVGSLRFSNETFDMLISMNGFHVFPQKEKAYENCIRVLKPGGILLGCFYIKGELGISDFLVNNFLVKKGWFTPPFETRESLIERLEKDFEIKWFKVNGAIVSFECIKK